MTKTKSNTNRTIRTIDTKLPAIFVTLAALLPAAGCETEDLRGEVIVSTRLVDGMTPEPGQGSWLYIYLAKDECVDNVACGTHLVRIDGKYAVWADSYDHVSMLSANMVGLIIPPGPHVITLENEDGQAIATTETVEARPDMYHRLAVFGPSGALVSRWLVDDPGTVPAGAVRTRLVNALAGGSSIEPVRCDAQRIACTPLAGALAHGAVFEADLAAADLEQRAIGWRLAGVDGAVFNGLIYRGSPPSHTFNMPILLGGDTCPSCAGSTFN